MKSENVKRGRTIMDVFNQLLEVAEVALSQNLLKKKLNNFYVLINGNWCKIAFQKSASSTKKHIKFTINIGINLDVVNNHYGTKTNNPSDFIFQLGDRVNFFLPDKAPIWWELTAENSTAICTEIGDLILEVIIPLLNRYTIVDNVIQLCDDETNTRWFNSDFDRVSLATVLSKSDPQKLALLKRDLKSISIREGKEEDYKDFLLTF